jgi:hypothetical protein
MRSKPSQSGLLKMLGKILKERRERKAREAHERELKQRLAAKFASYNVSQQQTDDDSDITQEITDYTEIMFQGKPLRVAKEQITILDVQQDSTKKD